MKPLLMAGALLAGASAPFTFNVQQSASAEAEQAFFISQSYAEAARAEAEAARADTAFEQARSLAEVEQLNRQRLELERAIEMMHRKHEIEALELELAMRQEDRQRVLELEDRAQALQEARRAIGFELDRSGAEENLERGRVEEQLHHEFRAAEREFEAMLAELERVHEHELGRRLAELEEGTLEEEEWLAVLAEQEHELAVARTKAEERLNERIHAMDQRRHESDLHWHAESKARELEKQAELSRIDAELHRLSLESEFVRADADAERELAEMRRAMELEEETHAMELRMLELESAIQRSEGLMGGSHEGSREPSADLHEVLRRLDRVETEIDKLWAAFESAQRLESLDVDQQNAANFRARR